MGVKNMPALFLKNMTSMKAVLLTTSEFSTHLKKLPQFERDSCIYASAVV